MFDDSILAELKARYGEAHRHYHVFAHVEDMLIRAAALEHRFVDRDAVRAAIYFHDAVYDPKAADNEEQSAALMRARLHGRLPPATVDAAETLIMATKTHRAGQHPDAALLIDIDLSILAAEPEVFDAYDGAIRKEFAHVPQEAYRAGRTRVLKGFLDRERIFVTAEYAPLEARARKNLAGAIERLA